MLFEWFKITIMFLLIISPVLLVVRNLLLTRMLVISDSDIIQLLVDTPDTSIATPVILSQDLCLIMNMLPHQCVQSLLLPEPRTPTQTDRNANLGSTEATNILVTPESTDQSQVDPAPARKRRRVSLERKFGGRPHFSIILKQTSCKNQESDRFLNNVYLF